MTEEEKRMIKRKEAIIQIKSSIQVTTKTIPITTIIIRSRRKNKKEKTSSNIIMTN